jgi:hypothetical protein
MEPWGLNLRQPGNRLHLTTIDHCWNAWNTLIDQPLENQVSRAPRLGNHRSFDLRIG